MAKRTKAKQSENWTLRYLSSFEDKVFLLAQHADEKAMILTADILDDESAWRHDLIIEMLRRNAKM
jgi:hypothetical protein